VNCKAELNITLSGLGIRLSEVSGIPGLEVLAACYKVKQLPSFLYHIIATKRQSIKLQLSFCSFLQS
jgi:hypothetical protein